MKRVAVVLGLLGCLLGWSVAGHASHEIPMTAEQLDNLGITVAPVQATASFATSSSRVQCASMSGRPLCTASRTVLERRAASSKESKSWRWV